MNVKNKKQRWKRWLEKDLLSEIRYLIKLKIVYKKLEDIFVGSKKYPKKSYFYWYLGQVHSAATIAGLYRLIDKRRDVVSLLRLLIEIKKILNWFHDALILVLQEIYTEIDLVTDLKNVA